MIEHITIDNERSLYLVNIAMDQKQLQRREAAGGVSNFAEYAIYIQRLSLDDSRFQGGRLRVLHVWENRGGSPYDGNLVDGVSLLVEREEGNELLLAFLNFLTEKGGITSTHFVELVSVRG
jgi:hypothetical protein